MIVDFKVHTVHKSQVNSTGMVDGKEVLSTTAALEVELVTVASRHGNLVLRFVGDEVDVAKAYYTKDRVIQIELMPE